MSASRADADRIASVAASLEQRIGQLLVNALSTRHPTLSAGELQERMFYMSDADLAAACTDYAAQYQYSQRRG